MQALVFLLVLVNVLFYAFSAGLFGQPDNPDAGRVAQQIVPEKIHLVSRGEAPSAKVAAPVVSAPVPVEQPVAAAAPAPVEKICLRWERLPVAEAARLFAAIDGKQEDFRISKKALAGDGGWWVHLPPARNRDEAERKAAELRAAGINDYFIVQEAGPNRFAISLGIFSTEKAGQDQMAEVRAKGFRTVRLIARPGKETLATVEASGPETGRDALMALAAKAAAGHKPVDCK